MAYRRPVHDTDVGQAIITACSESDYMLTQDEIKERVEEILDIPITDSSIYYYIHRLEKQPTRSKKLMHDDRVPRHYGSVENVYVEKDEEGGIRIIGTLDSKRKHKQMLSKLFALKPTTMRDWVEHDMPKKRHRRTKAEMQQEESLS